jgi:hypothetical protein
MATAIVTQLRPSNKQTTKQVRHGTRAARALRRQAVTAGAIGAVALTLTGLSLRLRGPGACPTDGR